MTSQDLYPTGPYREAKVLQTQDIHIFKTVHIFMDELSSFEVYASQKVWAEAYFI